MTNRFEKYNISTNRFSKYRSQTKNYDVKNIESLRKVAKSFGAEVKEKKPSLFSRALDLISRPMYASAGAAKAVVKGENILNEMRKGLYGIEKETYSDVLGEMGVKNKWAKGGVGFALDIALDPTTYFGGTLIKGAAKSVGKIGSIAGKGYARVAPKSAEAFGAAGKNLKDALGHAFVPDYGTTAGVGDAMRIALNKVGIAKEETINKYTSIFKKLPQKEHEEFAKTLFEHKQKIIGKKGRAMTKAQLNKIEPDWKSATQRNFFYKELKPAIDDLAKKADISDIDKFDFYIPSMKKAKLPKTSGATIKVGKEGYKKEFKGLIKDEELLNKPFEAYTRREVEVVRDKIARGSISNAVKAYGSKEATDIFSVAIRDKRVGGKILGYLKPEDASLVNNIMFPESKTIDLLAQATGYDKFTNWFKTAVTAYFPAFHVRNFLSGNVQNYQALGGQAFNVVNHKNGLGFIKGTKNIIKFKNWTGTGKDMQKILAERFGGSSRYISDLGNHIDDIMGADFKIKNMSKVNPRRLGNFIETWQKATAVSAGLKKGYTLEKSLKFAEKAGFDYSKITPFEQNVMKRIIPFYTFMRKNAELQAKTIAKRPERILNQIKFTGALSTIAGGKMTEEDLKGLPDWALDGLGFKLKEGKYVNSFGLPLEEFTTRLQKPLGTTLASTNPIIKYPLESFTGYNFFREMPIKDIDKIDAGIAEKLPEPVAKWLELSSYEYNGKTYYKANPKKLHIIENTPATRLFSTIKKAFDDDVTSAEKVLAFSVGARIDTINTEMQEYFREKDMREDLEEALQRKGKGYEFKQFIVPK